MNNVVPARLAGDTLPLEGATRTHPLAPDTLPLEGAIEINPIVSFAALDVVSVAFNLDNVIAVSRLRAREERRRERRTSPGWTREAHVDPVRIADDEDRIVAAVRLRAAPVR